MNECNVDQKKLTYWYFLVCLKRLASLLIVTQLVNQVTEVAIPFLVDRFISAPNRKESEDDPEEDKFRNQSTLPAYPVSYGARTVTVNFSIGKHIKIPKK